MALAEEKNQVIEHEEPKFRYFLRPRYHSWSEGKKIKIRVVLPGVSKDNVDLKVTKEFLILKATRDNVLYSLDLNLYDEILPNTSKATYNEGLLEVELTRYNPLDEAYKISIE